MGESDQSGAVGHHLVALDSGYGDVSIEADAARPFGVTISDAGNLPAEDALAAAAGSDGVLVCHLKLDAGVIARFPTWRVIGRYGAGFDNVDVEAAGRAGIAVVNVPDYCVEEAATHTAALVLAAWRKLFQSRRLVDDGGWRELAPLLPIPPLSRCTLGLVGAGRIGTEVVRLLGPLFEEVIAYAPSRRVPSGARWTDLDTVFAQSDVLSLHCPLTPETANLVDAARLASMKQGALLVNVSRGGLVDSTAVAEALRSGRLGGLALDVLPTEPPPATEPLLALPNVLITNHIAWYSEDSTVRLRQLLGERCAAYLVDRPVPSVVNAAALT
jgi:D-3-phosphoglycerate dehydrogenase